MKRTALLALSFGLAVGTPQYLSARGDRSIVQCDCDLAGSCLITFLTTAYMAVPACIVLVGLDGVGVECGSTCTGITLAAGCSLGFIAGALFSYHAFYSHERQNDQFALTHDARKAGSISESPEGRYGTFKQSSDDDCEDPVDASSVAGSSLGNVGSQDSDYYIRRLIEEKPDSVEIIIEGADD